MASKKKRKGGFTRKSIKNNPNMQVVRDSNSELTACSVFLKEFKIGIRPILPHFRIGLLHQKLMRLFLKIKSLDRISAAGDLNVADGLRTEKGRLLLREFTFTPKAGIRQFFGNPVIVEDDFSVVWEQFEPSQVRFPKGGTHWELLYLVMTYHRKQKLFSTVAATPIRRAKSDGSERLELRPNKPVEKGPDLQHILVISLRFIEILGEEEYPLLGKDAVGIEVLGVY